MNRREFISAITAALAAPAVAGAVQARPVLHAKGKAAEAAVERPAQVVAGFDPKQQYGIAIHLTDRSEAGVAHAKKLIIEDARKWLPSGTRFYVLDGGEANVHGQFGPQRVDMLAWYYSPIPLEGPRKAQIIAEVVA